MKLLTTRWTWTVALLFLDAKAAAIDSQASYATGTSKRQALHRRNHAFLSPEPLLRAVVGNAGKRSVQNRHGKRAARKMDGDRTVGGPSSRTCRMPRGFVARDEVTQYTLRSCIVPLFFPPPFPFFFFSFSLCIPTARIQEWPVNANHGSLIGKKDLGSDGISGS